MSHHTIQMASDTIEIVVNIALLAMCGWRFKDFAMVFAVIFAFCFIAALVYG